MSARESRTPAQLYALLFGITLLAAGILGFIADSSFDTGAGVQGGELVVFEVNGWHNLVHIASGLLGIVLSRRADSARAYALGFGAVYLLVTIYGFVDGNDIIGLLPINDADNVLHIALSALGLITGFMSRGRDDVPANEPRTVGSR